MKKTEMYVYQECGLDNVILHGVSFIKDEAGEDVVYIPKINLLHKLIVKAIIFKTGKITSKELRFVRTEMCFKQSEFSELLGKEAQAVGRWERGEVPIDDTIDMLLRLIANDYYKFDDNVNAGDFSTWIRGKALDSINIDVEKYEIIPAA